MYRGGGGGGADAKMVPARQKQGDDGMAPDWHCDNMLTYMS
jgi:hypothetical protein